MMKFRIYSPYNISCYQVIEDRVAHVGEICSMEFQSKSL